MTEMTDREQIEKLYLRMYEAMVSKDAAELEAVHDDSFVLHHMTGMSQSKREYIDAILNGTLNYYSASHDELCVTVSGDTARLSGRSTSLRPEPEKASSAMEEITGVSEITVKLRQFLKAPLPMVTTLLRLKLLMDVPEKASGPISVTELGSMIPVRLLQPWKVPCAIFVIPPRMITDFKLVQSRKA